MIQGEPPVFEYEYFDPQLLPTVATISSQTEQDLKQVVWDYTKKC